MYTLGIDIGSTTTKAAVLKDGQQIISTYIVKGGIGIGNADEVIAEALLKAGITAEEISSTTATGYGRNRFEKADRQASELTCHALGAHLLFPEARTVIDIGGQDAKIISLDSKGRMKNFLMNDKCAAGTGRFLDVMSSVLQVDVKDFSAIALQSEKPASISSTCTVFAESEVISQLAAGTQIKDIAAGVCDSVASRTSSLAKRLEIVPEVVMSGGVAQNDAVRQSLEKYLETKIYVSPYAQLFGAIGAAVYGYNKDNK